MRGAVVGWGCRGGNLPPGGSTQGAPLRRPSKDCRAAPWCRRGGSKPPPYECGGDKEIQDTRYKICLG